MGALPSKKCPVCGVSVKLENLEKHVRNLHPHKGVDLASLVTREERRVAQRRQARPVVTKGGLKVVAVVAAIVLVVFAVVLLNPFRGTGVNIGDVAPDFSAEMSTSGSVTLSNYRGQPTLLEFMDVDCEYCVREAPILAAVYGNYSARVHFLSVDANFVGSPDTPSRIQDFKTTHGTPWVHAIPDPKVVSDYGVTGTPTTFILDRNGVVVDVIRGLAPNGVSTYASALDKALRV